MGRAGRCRQERCRTGQRHQGLWGLDESKKLHARFALKVNPEKAASLIKAAFTNIEDEDALLEAWIRVVDVLNVPLYREWEEDTRVALENIKNRLSYTRLADHGPKLGEITEE